MIFAVMAALLVTMVLALVRAFLGPGRYNRILAINMFGTKTVLFVAVAGFFFGRPEFLDIGILYALVNFVATVAVLRLTHYQRTGRRLGRRRARMIVLDVLSGVLLGAGAFFVLSGGVGLLRFPDFYTRIHAAGITDSAGAGLILLGLLLQRARLGGGGPSADHPGVPGADQPDRDAHPRARRPPGRRAHLAGRRPAPLMTRFRPDQRRAARDPDGDGAWPSPGCARSTTPRCWPRCSAWSSRACSCCSTPWTWRSPRRRSGSASARCCCSACSR